VNYVIDVDWAYLIMLFNFFVCVLSGGGGEGAVFCLFEVTLLGFQNALIPGQHRKSWSLFFHEYLLCG